MHRDKENMRISFAHAIQKKLRENHPHSFLISRRRRRMPHCCFAPTNKVAAAAAAASGNKQISTTIFFVKNRPHWNVIYYLVGGDERVKQFAVFVLR